ncbi:MAG: hypothetical protein MUF38_11725 [Anaerolineae bacterium]|jgi:hypothetical protein|nr:hypothetical protein [Anaerolineae bacterium]
MGLRTNRIVKLVLLLNLALMLTFSPVAASDELDWRMVLYNRVDHTLFALTPDGITETWALPPDTVFVALSPSEDFAVLGDGTIQLDREGSRSLVLFNLETGECCEPLVTLDTFANEEGFGEGDLQLYGGSFSDSGTLLAFSLSFLSAAAYDAPYAAYMNRVAVIDLQTGELVGINPYNGDFFFAMWVGDEVALHPTMSVMPGDTPPPYQESTLQGWNPQTGEMRDLGLTVALLPHYGFTSHDKGEFLVTGEYISTSFTEATPGFTFPMVIYNDGSSSFPAWVDNYTFVGEYIQRLSPQTARWISDGRYIFNRRNNYYTTGSMGEQVEIVSRDGTINVVDVSAFDAFLTGTPNGWLAGKQVDGSTVIVEYIYDGDLIETREIATFSEQSEAFYEIRVVKPMPLGASLVDPQPFPEVQPPMGLG